ncbi:MAG TPA: phosphatase PAP2 family protein [Sedimentisphaerales bacterium]|nr:phosphatase PAP2 family protein [Sedimentisphaerales bacterium]
MTNDKKTSRPKRPGRNPAVVVLIAGLLLAALLSYLFVDDGVVDWLCRHPNQWYDSKLVNSFEQLGKALVPAWLLLVYFLATSRRQPVLAGLLALIIVGAAVFPVKLSVRRPRPQDLVKEHSRAEDRHDLMRSWSFPSGDTADAFAVAVALTPFVAWHFAPVFFAAAVGIGVLRVIVLAHYPSDVFAGAAMGVFCGWLALETTRRWLSANSLPFSRYRGIAVAGVVVIPVLVGLFQGLQALLTFLQTYGLAAGICLLVYAMWPGRNKEARNPKH